MIERDELLASVALVLAIVALVASGGLYGPLGGSLAALGLPL